MISDSTFLASGGSTAKPEEACLLGLTWNAAGYAENAELVVRRSLSITTVYEIELWPDTGCRACREKAKQVDAVVVASGAAVLLKSGDYVGVDLLVPGMRLRSWGGNNGFQEVKSVRAAEESDVYYVSGPENFGVSTPDGRRTIFVSTI